MCIIAYIPEGKQIKDETIRIMFEGNPDGSGIMWKPSATSDVQIRKGFMDVESLLAAYHEIPKSCEKAIHCRIATAGKISPACCHPFPVRKSVSQMKKAADHCDMVLMHNGIIDYCNPKDMMKANYSDSMKFAATILYPNKDVLDRSSILNLIEESTPSRLLIMRSNAPTIRLGDWQEEDGIFYSNSHYKPISALSDWKNFGCGYYSYDFGYGSASNSKKKRKSKKSAKQKRMSFTILIPLDGRDFESDVQPDYQEQIELIYSFLEEDGYEPQILSVDEYSSPREVAVDFSVNKRFATFNPNACCYEGYEIINNSEWEF